ncbi:MAG: CoA-transferase [Bacillati bacterium ANGP1]|uniref:CoA-transferase n=1 Tax=Candidatus Segetimicrobium genomatis TaxID=2569760 RepID=A0A537K1T9_9BACT|nr:MAG: CoA-transferase [Terrabacteria group bacterium ANGP1]
MRTSAITRRQVMVAAAAREIRDGEVVFVGMRLPLLGFALARALHAPRAVGLFENGVIRSSPPAAPIITMGDPPNIAGALACTTLADVMSHLQRGRVDVGFLGGAEVDRFGNLNTTWAEDRGRRIRLPGSGGAADIAALARRTVVLVHHERRRFPERVRYLTSPGFGTGRGWRETVGLVRGGPGRVITSLGVFGFDPESGEMVLESLHPGVTLEELRAETGWPVRAAPDLRETPGPTREELDAIRRFDPDGLWTG